ncbi:unnamed protein product [Triticum turgidum subsp. durum]|uniref:Uncharacterized protein n=1 Tax=Triticum turgidum subsp. durum TaxID=4567 RepID=A0A9R0WLZ8_TRITD|nr:unnamed protein product [Triticum turgidum subsp. durum]
MDASLCLCSSDRCSDPTACPLPIQTEHGADFAQCDGKEENQAARGGVLQCGPCVCQAPLQGKALRAGEKEALRSRRMTGWAFLGKAVSRGEEPRSDIVAWSEDLRQLCVDPRAKAAVLADMDSIGKEAQLRGFEFAKAVTLVAEPFTVENGLLTPTFKVKRPQAKAYFTKELADISCLLAAAEVIQKTEDILYLFSLMIAAISSRLKNDCQGSNLQDKEQPQQP